MLTSSAYSMRTDSRHGSQLSTEDLEQKIEVPVGLPDLREHCADEICKMNRVQRDM